MKKKILSMILCLLICIISASSTVYADNRIANTEKEIEALKYCLKDISALKRIECNAQNKYIMDYNGITEIITIDEVKDDQQISFSVTDGKKQDTCTITRNGDIIINGDKIVFTDEQIVPRAAWKSTYKGTKPYGSLTASSYNKYLSSSRSNAKMNDKIKNITLTALGVVLARFVPYAGIGIDIANLVKSFLTSSNPNTYNVSCTYDTYTCGADNYQYRTKIYATGNYTGSYKSVNTYEHFVIY